MHEGERQMPDNENDSDAHSEAIAERIRLIALQHERLLKQSRQLVEDAERIRKILANAWPKPPEQPEKH